MKIVLNEKRVLDKALEEGVIEDKPIITIKILAKHYFSIGQNKSQVTSSIESFMEKSYSGFNISKWEKKIKNVVASVFKKGKFDLVNIKEVIIYKNELEKIREINNLRLEKLAFVLLVCAKIYNQMNNTDLNWVNTNLKDIFSDTNMAVSKKDQSLMIYRLNVLQYLTYPDNIQSTNIKVMYCNSNGEEVIRIDDFRNYVFYYLKWIGETVENCEECGVLFLPTSNRNKYCKTCWKEINKEQTRQRVEKHRKCNGLENHS